MGNEIYWDGETEIPEGGFVEHEEDRARWEEIRSVVEPEKDRDDD
jgi:hypothetical protein